MATSTRAGIKETFSRITKEDFKQEELLELLYEIAVELGIAAQDLGNKWESFAVNRQLKVMPTLPNLHAFKQELREKHKSSLVVKKEKDRPTMDKSSLATYAAPLYLGLTSCRISVAMDVDMLSSYVTSNDQMQAFLEARKKREEEAAEEERKRKLMATEIHRAQRFKAEEPAAAGSPAKSSSQPSSQLYEARTNKGKITSTFNEALPKALASPTQVSVEELAVVRYDRCMNNKFDSMTAYLEGRLERLGKAAIADHKLMEEGLLERPSQEPIVSFGRICSELDHTVTLATLVIEGLAHGLKPRMAIDVSELDSFSIFPGQVAAVKGINNGKRFILSQMLPPLPPPHRPPPVDGVSLLIAAGPFSIASATSYEPFKDLLQQVKAMRPSAVILLGPFVDLDHPDIKSPASLENTFEGLFHTCCLEPLAMLKVHVILVPSVKDAHHMFPYPQPPCGVASEFIHPVSNPAMFSVNGVTIGASSADVLSLFVTEEQFKLPATASPLTSDRMARFCEHILQQKSFYPLHPPSIHDCVDVSLMKGAEMEYSPDILILPSVRDGFIKVASNTVCVNPGRLARNERGGTYASVVVHPKEGSSGSANAVVERVRGEIIHI